LTLFNDEIYICATNWGIGYAETRKNSETLSMYRSDVVVKLDVSSVGELFAVLVRQLVGAGLEHFNDDGGSFPRRRQLVAASIVLAQPYD
jgi:hypothetical protein